MAASHSTSSPKFLVFPTLCPVFTWRIVATLTNRTISRHRNLALAIDKAEKLNLVAEIEERPQTWEEFCKFEDEHYEYPCGKRAVACDRETGKGLCASHCETVLA